MKNKKVVIFDFDGTIADSEEVLFEVVNELAMIFGFRKVQKAEIPILKTRTLPELIKSFGISYRRLPFLVWKARNLFQKNISRVDSIKDILDVILQLKNRGYKVIIVTTNRKKTVTKFLADKNFQKIDRIYSIFNLFGKAKALVKVVKREGLEREKVYYVGDEIRDIEAAKKAGLGMISVGWGFNSTKALKKYQPDHLIIKPEQLLDILV